MYDDFKVANYSKALLSPELYARPLSRLYSGDVIDGLTVVPGTGLQVVLQPGNTFIRYGSAATASARIVSLVNTFNLTIPTPDVSNPRHDLVVVYIDNTVALPSGTPTTANLDGRGVAKARIVSGSPASSPSDPNNTAIQAAIGAGNPYTLVARVRTEPGVSVIAANQITDIRTVARAGIANAPAELWWEEVGRTTLTTSSNVINVPLRTDKRFIKVHVIFNSFSAAISNVFIRVNDISTAVYGGRVTMVGSTTVTNLSSAGTGAVGVRFESTEWPRHIDCEFDIRRPASGSGLDISARGNVVIGATIAGVVAASSMSAYSVFSSSLPALTSISVHTTGGQMNAGSTVVVTGHD